MDENKAFLSLFVAVAVLIRLSIGCPEACTCNGVTVSCSTRYVPNLPKWTRILILENLEMEDFTGDQFNNTTNLTSLTILDGEVVNFYNNSFRYIRNLEHLRLDGSHIRSIEVGVLQPLEKLKSLQIIGNWDLTFDLIARVLHGLRSTALETLHIDECNRDPVVVGEYFFSALRSTRIKNISLTDNHIVILQHGYSRYIPNIEYLNISMNYISGDKDALVELILLRKLRILDSSYQREVFRDERIHRYDVKLRRRRALFRPFCVPVPPRLEFVFASQLSSGPRSLTGMNICKNNLRVLDVSNNDLYSLDGSYVGMDHLEYINMNSCNIHDISSQFFRYFPNLKTLLLSHNFISYVFENETYAEMFRNNSLLETLDISANGVHNLSDGFLDALSNIKHFDVNSNSLSVLTIEPLTNLRTLNASNNRISYISGSVMSHLNELAKEGFVSVDLYQNPLTKTTACCKIQDFILWTKNTRVNISNLKKYSCIHESKIILYKDLSIDSLTPLCLDVKTQTLKFALPFALVGVFSIFVTLASVYYRKRWSIKWWGFLARKYWKIQQEMSDDTIYEYDAFVAFCVDDIAWVKYELVHNLEKVSEFRLCIHHRDFMPGLPIEENIVDAITKSRKTILVLSPSFVESNWCQFEVHMARNKLIDNGRDVIVPVVLSSFEIEHTSLTLRNILDKNTYLKWPSNAEGRHVFWNMLVGVLKKRSVHILEE